MRKIARGIDNSRAVVQFSLGYIYALVYPSVRWVLDGALPPASSLGKGGFDSSSLDLRARRSSRELERKSGSGITQPRYEYALPFS